MHVDGITGQVFKTEEDYLKHTNKQTGFAPTDIRHQGRKGILIAKEALRRTGSLKKDQEKDLAKLEKEIK